MMRSAISHSPDVIKSATGLASLYHGWGTGPCSCVPLVDYQCGILPIADILAGHVFTEERLRRAITRYLAQSVEQERETCYDFFAEGTFLGYAHDHDCGVCPVDYEPPTEVPVSIVVTVFEIIDSVPQNILCDMTERGADVVVTIAERLTSGWTPEQLRRSLRWAGEAYNPLGVYTFMEAPEFFGNFLRAFCPLQDFTEPDRWELDQQFVAAAKVTPDYPDYSDI